MIDDIYNLNNRVLRSGKAKRKLREKKAQEREAARQRQVSLSEVASVNKKPRYEVPQRNMNISISSGPRTKPLVTAPVVMTEEMIEREKQAQLEIERKKKCVAPAYNKGAYTYIASEEQALWVGRK